MKAARLSLLAVALLSLPGLAFAQHLPYAGQQERAVKSLSAQEVDDLLAGRGMGTARPAELSRHPGPAHVLELKDRLGLSPAQEERTRAIHAGMQARAAAAGKRVVEAERALDHAFAQGAIDASVLAMRVREAGGMHAEFRLAHLEAHLETKALLTSAQVDLYDEARGYAGEKPLGAHKH